MRRLAHRLSHRGGFLLVRSIIYAAIGYSLVSEAATPALRHQVGAALQIMSLTGWGLVWFAAAAVMAYAAFRPNKPPEDWFGFAAAAIVPTVWGLLYLLTWIEHGHALSDRTWVGAVIYCGFAAAPMTVAGMRNPVVPGERP